MYMTKPHIKVQRTLHLPRFQRFKMSGQQDGALANVYVQ